MTYLVLGRAGVRTGMWVKSATIDKKKSDHFKYVVALNMQQVDSFLNKVNNHIFVLNTLEYNNKANSALIFKSLHANLISLNPLSAVWS